MTIISRWSILASNIAAVCDKILDSISEEPNPQSRKASLAYALLARATSSLTGAVILLKANQVAEARMLVRACVEVELCLRALESDPDAFFKDLENDEAKSRSSRLGYYANNYKNPDDGLVEKIMKTLADIKKSHGRAQQMSFKKISDGSPTYVVYGQMSADSVHASLTSLERHLTRDENGTPRLRRIKIPDQAEVIDTFRWACLSTINSFEAANRIFDRRFEGRMREIVAPHVDLLLSSVGIYSKSKTSIE